MNIEVRRVEFQEIEPLRGLYRQEAACQIIHDFGTRAWNCGPLSDPRKRTVAGYGGVWNKYEPGRLMEFYTLPAVRGMALPMYRELLAASEATEIEAQTNMPLMLLMLYDCATEISVENVLFHDAFTSHLTCETGVFRPAKPGDDGPDKDGDWVIEAGGSAVASGGFLCHYTRPMATSIWRWWRGSGERAMGATWCRR